MAHIEEEAASLLTSDYIGSDRLHSLLAPFGLKQLASLGEVRYAGVCIIGKRKGIHLVVRGERSQDLEQPESLPGQVYD